jgi:biotin carboxyl carrier protein
VSVRFRLVVDGEAHDLDVGRSGRTMNVRIDGIAYPVQTRTDGAEAEVRVRGTLHRIRVDGLRLFLDGEEHSIRVESMEEPSDSASTVSSGPEVRRIEVRPPMPGRLIRLLAPPGTDVRRGQAIAVLEAMKMQNEVPSPADAVVREVLAREGEVVTPDRIIAVLETRRVRGR